MAENRAEERNSVREIPTFCRVCEPSCGLVARVENGELAKLLPDRDHPVTRGFACHKGLAGVEIHYDPDRLGHPLRRCRGGRFETASWDAAVSDIAERIRALRDEHGPDAIGFYLGNPMAFNSTAGPAVASLIAQLGSHRNFTSGTQDCANKFAGAEAIFGSSTIHPIPDLDHTHHVLLLGANPRVSHMSFLSIADPNAHLRDAVKRGATVRHVNPRRIESVDSDGGELVPIRPDTDLYLLAAMLHELDARRLWREDVIAAHARNAEGLRAFVAKYPPERAARVTGIPAHQIRRMAVEFAEAPSAAVYMSTGVNMGRQGTLCYWLLYALSLVTGNLDRRGGNLYALGFYPAAKAGRTDPARHFFDSPWGAIRRIRGSLPGNLLPDMIEAAHAPIRALIVVAGNPILSIGGGERLRRAFERLELLVCVDLYRTATGELAHWLLPATDMFERRDLNLCGLGLQHRPFVQLSERVVEPRDERREEWWIFARLAQALGMKSALDHGEEPTLFSRIDHMLAGSGLSIADLAREPRGIGLLPEIAPGRFFEEWIQTADRRMDLCPELFHDALARAEAICVDLESEPTETLKLITFRDDHMHNSWYQNVTKLKRRRHRDNPLHVHPEDAARLGIAEGQRVAVRSEAGRIETPIALDETLLPGVVAMVHGWGNERSPGLRVAHEHPGVNVNELLPSGTESFEPLSNQAFMTGIPVRIETA
jgi:anaerobic selenocysteine-containing dehydrogenase